MDILSYCQNNTFPGSSGGKFLFQPTKHFLLNYFMFLQFLHTYNSPEKKKNPSHLQRMLNEFSRMVTIKIPQIKRTLRKVAQPIFTLTTTSYIVLNNLKPL